MLANVARTKPVFLPLERFLTQHTRKYVFFGLNKVNVLAYVLDDDIGLRFHGVKLIIVVVNKNCSIVKYGQRNGMRIVLYHVHLTADNYEQQDTDR